MCHHEQPDRKRLSPEEAAVALARLISRECRVDIYPPDLLRLMLDHAPKIGPLLGDMIPTAKSEDDLRKAMNDVLYGDRFVKRVR